MKFTYMGMPVRIQFSTYANNGVTAMSLVSIPEGEPVSGITVNGPWPELKQLQKIYGENVVPIKNYSENTGMVQFLIENGLIDPLPVGLIPSGFVQIPLYLLSHKALNELHEQHPVIVKQPRKKVNRS